MHCGLVTSLVGETTFYLWFLAKGFRPDSEQSSIYQFNAQSLMTEVRRMCVVATTVLLSWVPLDAVADSRGGGRARWSASGALREGPEGDQFLAIYLPKKT